jgi:hypothetical protein
MHIVVLFIFCIDNFEERKNMKKSMPQPLLRIGPFLVIARWLFQLIESLKHYIETTSTICPKHTDVFQYVLLLH